MKRTFEIFIYLFVVTVLYSCKVQQPISKTTIPENNAGSINQENTSMTQDPSVISSDATEAISGNPDDKPVILSEAEINLREELLFKDIAPRYYLHAESIFIIPDNVKRITTTAKYEFYDYYFDKDGRLDSLDTKSNGCFKIQYNNRTGMIDYVIHSKRYDNSKNVKSTRYFLYQAEGDDRIAKYESDRGDIEFSDADLVSVFTFDSQGRVTKTNYSEPLEKNYIEYYTIDRGKNTVELIKSRAGNYFHIKGYELDPNGRIVNLYFTNVDMDLDSVDLTGIKDGHDYNFVAIYDDEGVLQSIENEDCKHVYEYYK